MQAAAQRAFRDRTIAVLLAGWGQQRCGPSRGALAQGTWILGQQFDQQLLIKIVRCAGASGARGVEQILWGTAVPVDLRPTLHAIVYLGNSISKGNQQY